MKILCNENEELQRRLAEAGQLKGVVADSENRISLLSQEIERLNLVLEKKNQEIGSLVNDLQELENMNITINTLQ